MGKKIVLPCLDVIMITFFPRNIQWKTFFGVSTILIATFFPPCLEAISDFFFFFLLLNGCTVSLSMGTSFVHVPDHSPSERAWDRMTVYWSSKFKMILANFSIFAHLKSLPVGSALGTCKSRNVPPKELVWSSTIYLSGKRRSLLHTNRALRSFFFPLQSYSRKAVRKIVPKSARKY